MARYFFNVRDGKDFIDDEGTELQGLDAVRQEAMAATTGMLCDLKRQFWGSGRTWAMSVADAEGNVVLTLRFAAD